MPRATPLLLLPGILNDARVWRPLEPVAAERKVVVAKTHLQDSTSAIAAAAIKLMPPGPFAVAGFSLGGYVALEVCRQAPRRIAGLALLDSGARADTEESQQNRREMISSLNTGMAAFDQVVGGMASKLLHPDHAEDEALLSLLLDMAHHAGQDGFVRQQTAATTRPDRREVLRSVHAPALVLCGEQDRVTPPTLSEEMAGLLPGEVERVILPQSGHLSTLEQPAAVAEAVARWLERVDAAAQ